MHQNWCTFFVPYNLEKLKVMFDEFESTGQIILGVAIIGFLIILYGLYRTYVRESKNHGQKQTAATWALIFGFLGLIIPFIGSLIGLTLGILSWKKEYNALSKFAIGVSVLTFIPWLIIYLMNV